jgi:TRAP-type C4-dicarboxylate transport system permease small subunit
MEYSGPPNPTTLKRHVRYILGNFEEILAGTFMVLMCVATFSNVVARYCFNSPIPWAEEFARYAFIWLVFVGAVVCTKHKRHICIDTAVALLPTSAQQFFRIMVDAAIFVLMIIILFYGWLLTAAATQPTATLGIPTSCVYIVAPLSALLILVRSLKDFWSDLRAVFIGGTR